jgi:hypothetical protein
MRRGEGGAKFEGEIKARIPDRETVKTVDQTFVRATHPAEAGC